MLRRSSPSAAWSGSSSTSRITVSERVFFSAGMLATRSAARNEPERSSVAPPITVVLARRLRWQGGAGEGDGIELAGLVRLDVLQVLELLQPLADQLLREAAQAALDD